MGNTTAARRIETATVVRIAAVVVAILLVSVAMLQRSQSAFSGTTTYGNTSALGGATVNLTNAAAGRFDVSNLVPGDSVTRCVTVAYDGTATAGQLDSVRVYGADTSGGGLAPYLDIKGEMATAGTTCADATAWGGMWLGKMDATFAANGTYATSQNSPWVPSRRGDTRAFRFTVSLPANAPDAAQGKTAAPVITFEVRTKAGTDR